MCVVPLCDQNQVSNPDRHNWLMYITMKFRAVFCEWFFLFCLWLCRSFLNSWIFIDYVGCQLLFVTNCNWFCKCLWQNTLLLKLLNKPFFMIIRNSWLHNGYDPLLYLRYINITLMNNYFNRITTPFFPKNSIWSAFNITVE